MMKSKFLRFSLRTILWALALLLLVSLTILLLHWQTTLVSKAVESYINRAMEGSGTITFSDIKGRLINHVRIEDLRVNLNDSLVAETAYLDVTYDIWALLDKEIRLSRLTMDDLTVRLQSAKSAATKEETRAFNLDSTLLKLENVAFLDSLLKSLPVMDISDLEVISGRMRYVTANDSLEINDIRIRFSLQNKPSLFAFELITCRAELPKYDLQLKNLSFTLLGRLPRITLNAFQLNTAKSFVLFSGDVVLSDSLQMLLSLDRFNLDFAEWSRLPGLETLGKGTLRGNALITGIPRFFNTQWHLSGNIRNIPLDTLVFDADYDYGAISILDFRVKSGESRIAFKGDLDLRGTLEESEGGKGNLRFSNIDVDHYLGTGFRTNINGRLRFKLENLKLDNPHGRGELLLYDTLIDTVSLDSLRFALSAKDGIIEVSEPSYLKFADQALFYISGYMDRKKLIDFKLNTEKGELLSLSQSFGMDSLHGNFDARVRATGYLTDPDIEGRLWIKNFAFDNISFDSIALNLDIHRILTKKEGFLKFLIDSGYVYEMPVSDVRMHVEIDSNLVNISQLGFRSESNYLNSALRLRFESDTLFAEMDYFRSRYQDYYLENNGTMSVIADPEQVSLEQLRLKGPSDSELQIYGFWDHRAQDLQLSINLENLALKPFEQIVGQQHRFGGFINGMIEIITPLTDPVLEVDIETRDLELDDVYLGNITSIFQFAENQITISRVQLNDKDAFLDISGELAVTVDDEQYSKLNFLEQTKADLKINWANIDLGKYASLLGEERKLEGILTGYLEAEGTVNEPFVRQSLRMHRFRYGDIAVDSLVMFGQYSSGYLIIDSLSAVVNETGFALKGWQKYDLKLNNPDTLFTTKPFEFIVTSRDDAINIIGLFNEQLESIRGPYDLEIYLGGTLEHPSISKGHFRLQDGEILLSRVRDPIRSVNIEAVIEDSILQVREFSGYSLQKKDFIDRIWKWFEKGIAFLKGESTEEGYITAGGTVHLADITRPKINIDVTMQEFFVDYFIENTSLLINSDRITISGRDTITIAGDIVIAEGLYEVDLSQMQKNIYLTAPQTEPVPPFIAADLNILIPGNFIVSSSPLDLANNFKIVMEGELGVRMEPDVDDPRISGQLNTVSGKYASWNQNFEVESGSIIFTNPEVINPEIELTAEKRISKYIVQLIIGGNLEKQSYNIIVLDKDGTEVPMSMPEKLSLLTLGTDLAMVTSKSDSTILSVGEDIATTSVLTAVERGAETFTGLDKVEINSDDKLLDLQKMKLNNGLEDASISFGKYLTSDLYVEYRTNFGKVGSGIPAPRLSWDAGNRIGLQYRINRDWALDSFYEKTLRGSKIKIGLSWEYTF